MGTTTVRFREERRSVKARVKCTECGDTFQRMFTGSATHNPFNKGNPIEQAQESAERGAKTAREKGIVCNWCEEAPQREALLALADGTLLPKRKWNNPTDLLLDRGNVKEIIDRTPCPTCGTPKYEVIGHEITEKGWRAIERARKGIEKRGGQARPERR